MKKVLLFLSLFLSSISVIWAKNIVNESNMVQFCAPPVIALRLELGHAKPYPEILVPHWENNRPVPNMYAEWKSLAGKELTAHCYYKKSNVPVSPTSIVSDTAIYSVSLPDTVTECSLFRTQFTCR